MKIKEVLAREIFDSRGWPTVECELILEDNTFVRASVPSGLSRSSFEGVEVRDSHRLQQRGVQKAVETIHTVIAPLILDQAPQLVLMDSLLLELDDTPTKKLLGTNTMLAVSMAVCKAQAVVEELEIFELIALLCEVDHIGMPRPMFNMINGGLHAQNALFVQEIMIMPIGVQTFREGMELAVTIFWRLKEYLNKKGLSTAVGDEGGFAAAFKNEYDALDTLMHIVTQEKLENNIMLAVDIAASGLYSAQEQLYTINQQKKNFYEMVEWYEKLIKTYPIYAIEDGLSEIDWHGWKHMTQTVGNQVQLIGDDIFATNAHLIWEGIEQKVANAVLIKPNQIGTITQTLQAIRLCQEYEKPIVISHRSGETNDSFIADLAVGANAAQIKAGNCCRGERLAKYNRLLRIEEELLISV